MARALKIAGLVAGGAVLLFAIVVALAWAFLPRDWIAKEAQRQASQATGAAIRWQDLSPGFEDFSLGIRITGFSARMPATGPASVDARVQEIFVRFRLLPLLFRRVEVSAATVRHASVALVDRGALPPPKPAGGAAAGPGMALVLPRIDLQDLSLSSRDPLGGGFDLKGISGHSSIDGALPKVRGLSVDLKAESLLWKPSAREPLVPLPGPARVDVALASDAGGRNLSVTRGSIDVGPLKSAVTGGIQLDPAVPGGSPLLNLRLAGSPQAVRSEDAAFKGLAAKTPAKWNGTASWDVRVGGSAAAPITQGTFAVKPLRVEAQKNVFAFDAIQGTWNTAADQSYSANVTGNGSGLHLEVEARGSTRPGGSSSGTLLVQAPAARLNGLVPGAPTWQSGNLECRAAFELRPPAPPQVRWTVTGQGLNGTVPGLTRPVTGFNFHLDGDDKTANVRDLRLTVGSTTALVTGSVRQEKPLGTGTFDIRLDRFVAEEWAPPKGAPAKKAAPGAAPAAAPPIPLRALDATVRVGEVRSGGMTVRDLVAPIRYANGALSVSPIKGAIGTGSVEGGLDIKSLIAQPQYALHMDVKRAPVEQVAAGVLPFKSVVTGFLTGTVDLSGPGLPGPEATSALRGALSGTVEQGTIAANPTLTKLGSALGIAGSAGGVAFRTITQTLRIEGGKLLLDKVKGDLGIDRFDLAGSLGLDQSLNLALHLSLAPQRVKGGGTLGALAAYARDAEGRIPVDVTITGNTRAPAVSLKPGRMLEAATERLKQNLGSQLLKSLAPQAKPGAPAESARAQARPDTTPESALQKGRDALKRLLGK